MCTLQHTGVSLNGIAIHLSPIRDPGSLVLSPDIRKQLSLSTQHLINFQFTVPYRFQRATSNYTLGNDLNDFLSACLDTSSLQDVRISTGCYPSLFSAGVMKLGKVMGSRPREKLTRIFLDGPSVVDLSQLTDFLNALPGSMTHLHLATIHLWRGTWKQALDELRKKKYHIKNGILRAPQGAECNYMSDGDVKKVFGTPYCHDHASEADRYIVGQDPEQRNPL